MTLASTPGALRGKITFQKVRNRLAPSVSAISRSEPGMRSSTVAMGKTAKGSAALTRPMVTPSSL